MKRLLVIVLSSFLFACGGGGGGVETTTYVASDPAPSTDTSNDTSQDATSDTSPTAIDVPEDFDFSNFHTVALSFTVPGDLVGQIDYKIAGEWDGQVQDLYIGRGYANQQRTVDINVPTAIDSVRIEYMAFDKNSGTAQISIIEESI